MGECWQVLVAEEKELYESQASLAKEKYNLELSKYKKTTQYQEYSLYLAEFKIKNAPSKEGKVFLWLINLITFLNQCQNDKLRLHRR